MDASRSSSCGGWRLHAEATGLIDAVADTDEEALGLIRTFLGYLPRSNAEPAPRHAVAEGTEERTGRILEVMPAERSKVYEPDTIHVIVCALLRYCDRQARLAHAAGSSQCYQAIMPQQVHDFLLLLSAPDERGQGARKSDQHGRCRLGERRRRCTLASLFA